MGSTAFTCNGLVFDKKAENLDVSSLRNHFFESIVTIISKKQSFRMNCFLFLRFSYLSC